MLQERIMKRREFLKYAGLSIASATLFGCDEVLRSAGRPNKKRPNLLFVFPDQMRGQAIGLLNEDPVITPNLDKFAAESLVLPQAVVNYPICSPYRAMLMTGKYPHSNNVLINCNSDSAPFDCQLRQDDRCWSDILKEKDYSLGYIGKWHLDAPYKPYVKCANNRGKVAWNEWCPPDRRHGFDFWYAYGTYDYHFKPMYWRADAGRDEHHFVDQWGPEHEADLAIKYIKNEDGGYRDPNKPFALVVSMNPPHMPYNLVPKKYVDMYSDKTTEGLCSRLNIPPADARWGKYYRKHIKNYLAMVSGIDDQFARILAALKQAGLEDDTIVVFTSDHGNCLGIHNEISKHNHYEESMRVPFMIRWPNRIAPRKDPLLISTPDLYPTLLDMMGLEADIPKDVEGTSHAKLFLTGKGHRPDSQLYMRVPLGKPALGQRGLRTSRYTLVMTKRRDRPVTTILHDNQKDPYQLKNVAESSPSIVRELTEKLEKQLRKNNDPWLDT